MNSNERNPDDVKCAVWWQPKNKDGPYAGLCGFQMLNGKVHIWNSFAEANKQCHECNNDPSTRLKYMVKRFDIRTIDDITAIRLGLPNPPNRFADRRQYKYGAIDGWIYLIRRSDDALVCWYSKRAGTWVEDSSMEKFKQIARNMGEK